MFRRDGRPAEWDRCSAALHSRDRKRIVTFGQQSTAREKHMVDTSRISEHMEVIGADGVHVGTVDRLEGGRIKLTKKDSGEGSHEGHHHFIPISLVADIEGQTVRLSANGDVAVTFEEEADGSA